MSKNDYENFNRKHLNNLQFRLLAVCHSNGIASAIYSTREKF